MLNFTRNHDAITYTNKVKDDIRSAYVYFSFFHETVNSHNLEIEPTILLTLFSCFNVL